jgi:outer membrane murein-binding lipoprotein Lpp
MSIAVRVALILFGLALIAGGIYEGYRTYERDQLASLVHQKQEALQEKQKALQVRIDALRSEMRTATSDPAEIKIRQERLSVLQRDLDSLVKESRAH